MFELEKEVDRSHMSEQCAPVTQRPNPTTGMMRDSTPSQSKTTGDLSQGIRADVEVCSDVEASSAKFEYWWQIEPWPRLSIALKRNLVSINAPLRLQP
jgi:hypothetical protein